MTVGGLFGAMDAAISGMALSQLATQVINHNIANANTPGYARQRLLFGAMSVSNITPVGSIGRGVQVFGVESSRDAFLEAQVLSQTAVWGDFATMDEAMRSVESIVGSVDNDRIGTAMAEFFSAWSDLSSPPVNQAKRQAVAAQARNLALQFQSVDRGLEDLAANIRTSYQSDVEATNSLLQRIAAYNRDILRQSAGGQPPHDLVDQRDLLIRQLSELTGAETIDRGDGTVDVAIGGHALVVRGDYTPVRAKQEELADGSKRVQLVFGKKDDIAIDVPHGTLGARQRMINEGVTDMRAELDALAKELADRVNELHRQGVTPIGEGVDFFTGSTAGDLALNVEIQNDPSLIATGTTLAEGDNSLALAIAALGESVSGSGGTSLNERYERFIVGIAADRGSYATLAESQQAIIDTAISRLDATRGVNLDEELANLVVYQRTFEANARVVRAVDEMLDTLVNGLI